jgi:hypothetical protein
MSYLLHGSRDKLKMSRNVASKHSCLECLDMATDIGFRGQQVSFVHVPKVFIVAVRHNYMRPVRLDLLPVSANQIIDCILTMSSVSQSVPLPFRSTSSGLSGMMLHSEKMKGWTYFI